MKLTKEKKEILLVALAQLLMKNNEEGKIIEELFDEIDKEIEVID